MASERKPSRGLWYIARAAFWFSLMSLLVKLAGRRIPSLEIVFAHIGSTDVLQHIKGDEPNYEFLLELDGWLTALKQTHQERFGAPLRVTMLSDHGNSHRKIYMVNGIQNRLRKHGMNASNRLEKPGDVVASSFGVGIRHIRAPFLILCCRVSWYAVLDQPTIVAAVSTMARSIC